MPVTVLNGTPIHYHVQGSGIPIVFIHPPLLTKANFNYQNVQLSDVFKVITFDIRGHGRSPASEEPITYALISEDIKQLLDFLEIDKAYLCGYSTGGAIVLEAMLTYPDRFLGGIVVSGMSEMSDWYNQSRLSLAVATTSIKAKDMIVMGIALGNADSITTFSKLYKDAKYGNVTNWKQYYQYSQKYNCTGRLDAIKAPILLIFGEKDKKFHRYAKILHRRLPRNELRFIPNLKHQIPTKAAGEMNRMIRNWVAGLQREDPAVLSDETNMQYDLIAADPVGHEHELR